MQVRARISQRPALLVFWRPLAAASLWYRLPQHSRLWLVPATRPARRRVDLDLNALRLAKSIVVPPKMLENLRQVREMLPWYAPPPKDAFRVAIGEVVFEAGEDPGYSFKPNLRDVDQILRNVRRGKQFADFCIATNHGHEPEEFTHQPAYYEQTFARETIDAGADVYISRTTPCKRHRNIQRPTHLLRFGNFLNQDLRTPVGADMFDAHGKDPRVDWMRT